MWTFVTRKQIKRRIVAKKPTANTNHSLDLFLFVFPIVETLLHENPLRHDRTRSLRYGAPTSRAFYFLPTIRSIYARLRLVGFLQNH